MTVTHEDKPSAWLIPRLVDFKNARNVYFTRQEGCTMTDEELKEAMSGTVQWGAEVLHLGDGKDGGRVVDKHGVSHYPIPLYKKLTANAK